MKSVFNHVITITRIAFGIPTVHVHHQAQFKKSLKRQKSTRKSHSQHSQQFTFRKLHILNDVPSCSRRAKSFNVPKIKVKSMFAAGEMLSSTKQNGYVCLAAFLPAWLVCPRHAHSPGRILSFRPSSHPFSSPRTARDKSEIVLRDEKYT